MNGKLCYQGHASFRLETAGGLTVYLDPFAGDGYDKAADLIVCTHEHRDHNCVDLMPHAAGCRILRYTDLMADGSYQSEAVGDVTVRAVPACNKNHPRDVSMGVVLTVGTAKLYFAGDTSYVPEMGDLKEEGLDYAFFPCDGFYNMDVEEASRCAAAAGAAHSVPIHTCKDSDGIFDRANAGRFQAAGRIILEPGETMEF